MGNIGLIAKNTAEKGGGIALLDVPEREKPTAMNNTIVDNSVSIMGGGILTTYTKPRLMNTIIWGNSASIDHHISGSILIQYSDIEGGYWG